MKSQFRTRWCVLSLIAFLFVCPSVVLGQTATEAAETSPAKTYLERLKTGNPIAKVDAARDIGALRLTSDLQKEACIALAKSLEDSDKFLRDAAGKSLLKIGAPCVQSLINVFESDDENSRDRAAGVLDEIGLAAVQPLTQVVISKRSTPRMYAIFTLNSIGVLPDDALTSIFNTLIDQSEDFGPRFWAAIVLANAGRKDSDVVATLTQGLAIDQGKRRPQAANALAKIGDRAQVAIPQLQVAMQSTDRNLRIAVAEALERMGGSASQAKGVLLTALKEERAFSETALAGAPNRGSYIDLGYSPIVWEVYLSFRVQERIARALLAIKAEQDAALTTLFQLLTQKPTYGYYDGARLRLDNVDRIGAAFAGAGAAPVPRLIQTYVNSKDNEIRIQIIESLASIGPEAQSAIPLLVGELRNSKETVDGSKYDAERFAERIVNALGEVGSAQPDESLPQLTEAFQSQVLNLHSQAANAILRIAQNLDRQGATKFISRLSDANSHLAASDDPKIREIAGKVDLSIGHLRIKRWQNLFAEIRAMSYYLAILIALIVLFLIWLILLWIKPVWLFHINETLSAWSDLRLPASLGGFSIPLRYAILVGFFHFHTRVLNAWVSEHVVFAQEVFSKKPTVDERSTHVPVPITINNEDVVDLKPENLAPIFSKNTICIDVLGEGGSGKTSLACLIAKWVMDKETSPLNRPMLPLLLEEDEYFHGDDEALLHLIQDDLRLLTGEEELPSLGLVKQLLKRRHILVIVDGLSEMKADSRTNVLATLVRIQANAVLVTGRTSTAWAALPRAAIKPMRINGAYLSSFLGAYLTYRCKREAFEDEAFFEACRRLSQICGNRDVTVLLGKLYAEYMISSTEKTSGHDTPKNIPDLMLSYLNTINRRTQDSDLDHQTVHQAAKVIAWQCAKNSFRPTPADQSTVLAAFGAEKGLGLLTYLEEKLKLIQTIGISRDRLRFVLDPLCEYLAGMYVVERYGKNEEDWRKFLNQANHESKSGAEGFMLAVRDCCLARADAIQFPPFLYDELSKWDSSARLRRAGVE